jgi:hypothetical protein
MHPLAIAAAAALLATPTAPASVHPEPWQPFRSPGFTAPAGKYCPFEFTVATTKDEEQSRVDARYADGTVHILEIKGALITVFTNTATNTAITRDLSGRGWEEFYPDGKTLKSITVIGPFSIGFRSTDDFPQGYYRLDGLHTITIDPDGTRHMPIAAGPFENLCLPLGE